MQFSPFFLFIFPSNGDSTRHSIFYNIDWARPVIFVTGADTPACAASAKECLHNIYPWIEPALQYLWLEPIHRSKRLQLRNDCIIPFQCRQWQELKSLFSYIIYENETSEEKLLDFFSLTFFKHNNEGASNSFLKELRIRLWYSDPKRCFCEFTYPLRIG